tara:strand:+ start:1380 stop:1847 length:468 start_codon:yes stop_codon:yes gene_type:complete
MRRHDKKQNIRKANLLFEQRCNESKEVIKENDEYEDLDVDKLKTLVSEYPDLVDYYPRLHLAGLKHRFNINKDESLTYGEFKELLPWYDIGIVEAKEAFGGRPASDAHWQIEKHTYTPNGRGLHKVTHTFPVEDTEKVYKVMKRVIGFLLKKSKT